MGKPKHDYHIIDPSPLPIMATIALFALAIGGLLFMHDKPFGPWALGLGMLLVNGTLYYWWKEVIREGREDKAHKPVVQVGLRIGMALFIVSELMFFFGFFFAYFKSSLMPMDILGDVWPVAEGIWPPEGIQTFDPWTLPFLNTLILLLSGTSVTWAHHALLEGDEKGLVQGLTWTVILGFIFTLCQAYEYHHAAFGFTDGIYASNFYMATGFHGLHVLVGTIFLFICLLRARKGGFTKKHHLGFEFAAWYWHFVDVVWLFLFVFVYVLGR